MFWPCPLETQSVSPNKLENLTVLAYSFRDSKFFALLI